ncbi:MAG TPA: hypothetical protein VGG45_07180 [Terracidiphilus sp.]|jgi:hypothetical protein
MIPLTQVELRNHLATQKYRLATALNSFYTADTRNPTAGDAAAIEIAQTIRVLAHGNEALLRQLMSDFEDRLIAFDPKVVKQVPDVELTPGNFAQTRGMPQDVVIMGDRVRYDRKKLVASTPRASLRDWWNRVCWDGGANNITNKEIILGLANKDGGAHIDGSGYPNYRKAKEQGQMFFGQQLSNIAKMGHLAAIAGDQLKAFTTENFGKEPNEAPDFEGPEGAHIGDLTITVYYKM